MENNFENRSESKEAYPVALEIKYPERSSRLLAFLGLLFFFPKTILLIPHFVALWILGIVSFFASLLGFLAVIFTGKYPRSLFDFITGVLRWQTRVSAWMYSLVDKYPPFSLE